jgi:predicted DNA-binding transcriptional regulator AlpA
MATRSSTATTPERLATTDEVADYLGVPAKTLLQWRYWGQGPDFIKVGRYVRYDWNDVRKWLVGRKKAAAGVP